MDVVCGLGTGEFQGLAYLVVIRDAFKLLIFDCLNLLLVCYKS